MKIQNNRDTAALQAAVQDVVHAYAGRGYFPSAVVSIFDREKTLCRVTYGDVREDTVYDVASLSKIATATQVLLLIDQGRLRLDDKIVSVLPLLAADALLMERLGNVTIRMLLTHTSGLVDWYPFYVGHGDFYAVLHEALARYGAVSGMVYSDIGFMLLGKAIEAVCGEPLDACLQKLLVAPYGLGCMTYKPDKAWDIAPSCYGNPIEEEMCRERGIVFGGFRPHEPVYGDSNDGNAHYFFGDVAGSAGVFANVAAYEKLCQMHMNSQSALFAQAREECAPGRGLGFQRGEMYPDGCGHTGFTGTSLYINVSANIGAVAFTNRLFYTERNPNPTNEFRRALHTAVAGFGENS